jgi:exonuclease III
MAGNYFRIVTRNIASSKRPERIVDIVKSEKPDLLLLQEVTLSTTELQAALQGTHYKCECNIDIASLSSPGTAAVWREDLPAP